MSRTRFISIVTVVEVQATSNGAALKLARKYVNVDTGPGDIVNVVEDKTRFYDITKDHIFYELYDAEEEEVEEYEEYEDEEVFDGTTTSDYDPLINFDEDKFDDDGGRTHFDADEELQLLKLEIEKEAENWRVRFDIDEELRLAQGEAKVNTNREDDFVPEAVNQENFIAKVKEMAIHNKPINPTLIDAITTEQKAFKAQKLILPNNL